MVLSLKKARSSSTSSTLAMPTMGLLPQCHWSAPVFKTLLSTSHLSICSSCSPSHCCRPPQPPQPSHPPKISFALRGYRQQATGKKSAERSEQIEFMQSFMHSSNSQQSKSTCDKLDSWSFSTDACSASWSLRNHQKDEEQRDLQSGEKWKYYSWSIMVQLGSISSQWILRSVILGLSYNPQLLSGCVEKRIASTLSTASQAQRNHLALSGCWRLTAELLVLGLSARPSAFYGDHWGHLCFLALDCLRKRKFCSAPLETNRN